MYKGGVFIVTMEDSIKDKFYMWAERGNQTTAIGQLAPFGFKFNFHHIKDKDYFLVMEHSLLFNMEIFLKLYFILMARKRRKQYTIRTATKIDLINYNEVKIW